MIDISCLSSDRAEPGELQQSCSCTQVALHLLTRGRTGAAATGEVLPEIIQLFLFDILLEKYSSQQDLQLPETQTLHLSRNFSK